MDYTPDEVARLLAERPHQPHYIAAMIRKCIDHAAARAVREAVPELFVADWTGAYFVRLGEQWFRVYPQKMLTPQEFGELGGPAAPTQDQEPTP